MEKTSNAEDKPWLWKPGVSQNPGGRPALPEDIRLAQREKTQEYWRKFIYWSDAPRSNIEECTGAPWPITGMDHMICAVLKRSFAGNVNAMAAILDRLVGKPKQTVEVSGPEGGPLALENVTESEIDRRLLALEKVKNMLPSKTE